MLGFMGLSAEFVSVEIEAEAKADVKVEANSGITKDKVSVTFIAANGSIVVI